MTPRHRYYAVQKALFVLNGDEYQNPRFLTGYSEADAEAVRGAILQLVDKAQAITGGLSLRVAAIEQNWADYIPMLFRLLEHVEAHPETRGLRRFPILPETGFAQSFVPFNALAIKGSWGAITGKPISQAEFQANREELWAKAFDTTIGTTANRCPEAYFETDGTAVSIILSKPALPSTSSNPAPLPKRRSKASRAQAKIYQNTEPEPDADLPAPAIPYPLEDCHLFSLDPGRKFIFTAVDQDKKRLALSAKEWYNQTGATAWQKKEKALLQESGLGSILSSLPPANCTTMAAFRAHCHGIARDCG